MSMYYCMISFLLKKKKTQSLGVERPDETFSMKVLGRVNLTKHQPHLCLEKRVERLFAETLGVAASRLKD